MPPDLAGWFAELPQDQSEATPSPDGSTAAPELAGALLPAAEGLPLLCRGCRACDGQHCGAYQRPASFDLAGYCQCFKRRIGVELGKVWLWRIDQTDGPTIGICPPITPKQVREWAQKNVHSKTKGVYPLPGFKNLPLKILPTNQID